MAALQKNSPGFASSSLISLSSSVPPLPFPALARTGQYQHWQFHLCPCDQRKAGPPHGHASPMPQSDGITCSGSHVNPPLYNAPSQFVQLFWICKAEILASCYYVPELSTTSHVVALIDRKHSRLPWHMHNSSISESPSFPGSWYLEKVHSKRADRRNPAEEVNEFQTLPAHEVAVVMARYHFPFAFIKSLVLNAMITL